MRPVLLLLVLAGCPEPAAVACGGDLFCPEGTTCGGFGVCLVEDQACVTFPDDTPCRLEAARGFCLAGACDSGVALIGAAEAFPLRAPLKDVRVTARDRPDIIPSDTNINGYFEVVAPRGSRIVIEVAYPGALEVFSREIIVGDIDLALDEIYGSLPIVLAEVAASVAEKVGTTLDPGRGIVSGSAFDESMRTALAGVEVTADGCTGPFYFGPMGPVLGATATLPETGVFAFVNCEPGPRQISATRSGAACRTIDRGGAIAIDAAAGSLAFVGRIVCP